MNKTIAVLCLVVFCGCFGHSSSSIKSKPAKAKTVKVSRPAKPGDFQISGKMIDAELLKKGGKLAFAPFKAGPLAVADDQLDRLSLMLTKGIREELSAAEIPLNITDVPEEADFILEGYVEEFSAPGKLSRLVMRKKVSKLSISGEIWYHDTGLKSFMFASARKMTVGKDDPLDAAYAMGKAVGNYIVTLLKE